MNDPNEKAVWVTVEFSAEEFQALERVWESFEGLPFLHPTGEGEGAVERGEGWVRLRIPFSLDEFHLLEQRLDYFRTQGYDWTPGEFVRRITLEMLNKYTVEELASKEEEKLRAERREIQRLNRLWEGSRDEAG